MEEMTKEVHFAPQNIRANVNGKNQSKSQELLGPIEPTNSVRVEVDESRLWDPWVIEIDLVTKNSTNQGIVESADNNDSTDLEITDLNDMKMW